MESTFGHLRQRLTAPPTAPLLVAVDLPGNGLRVYNAELIRTLFSTSLFPYKVHIIHFNNKATAGADSPLLILDRVSADFLRSCLYEAARNSPGYQCPVALKHFAAVHSKSRFGESGDWNAASYRTLHIAKSFIDAVPQSSQSAPRNDVGSVLEKLPTDDSPITLSWVQVCTPVGSLKGHQKKAWGLAEINDGEVCRFHITLPRMAASAYFNITLRGTIRNPRSSGIIECGPNEFKIPVDVGTVNREGCTWDLFQWDLSGKILSPPPTSQLYEQEFQILVHDPSESSLNLKIFLEGIPKPPLRNWIFGPVRAYWCFPAKCE
jgi:hypothetical protein